MSQDQTTIDEAKRRIRVEQAVRDFLHILDQQELDQEEAAVAWYWLGNTIFQDVFPNEDHPEIHQRMLSFAEHFFESNYGHETHH